MPKNLTQNDIQNLIVGSSIYSTGGGFDIPDQQEYFQKIANNLPELISIDELDDEDYICTAYAVGPAVSDKNEKKIDYLKVLKNFEKITGKKIKVLFAGEINIEGLVFETASNLGLPVLDADCCGGRAVPEIQMDTFFANEVSITPALMINGDGEELLYSNTKDNFKLENIARNFAVVSGSSVFIIDHLAPVKTAKKALTLGTLSRSIKTGEFIASLSKENPQNIQKISQECDSKVAFEGQITKVDFKIENGFLIGFYLIKNSQSEFKVVVKNENMVCYQNDQIVCSFPDSIITLDASSYFGLHNSQLKVGDKVCILLKKSVPDFQKESSQKLFNLQNFGLSKPVTF